MKNETLKAEFSFENSGAVGVRVNAVIEVARIDYEGGMVSFNKDVQVVPREVLVQIVNNWDENKETARKVKEKEENSNK